MSEKRIHDRKNAAITTILKKQLPDGSLLVMEFLSLNLSQGGVFIMAEDLSILDLGDEAEILVDIKGDKYYEGKAKVVRSARIFMDDPSKIESGFGLMFLEPGDEFKNMLAQKLEILTE